MTQHQAGNFGPIVAFLTSYPPRKCGIASFTQDLCDAVASYSGRRPQVIAIDEPDADREYGREVNWRLSKDLPTDYERIAARLNEGEAEVLCVQHEYGLFGNPDGELLLTLLRELRLPVVTTLHTTLSRPSDRVLRLTKAICDYSAEIVVISRAALSLLQETYGVNGGRIRVIQHGAPRVKCAKAQRTTIKSQLNLTNRTVLMTFGLIGPNKGIEYALAALPRIVNAHPDLLYVILGETHPGERSASGERYRSFLKALVAELGLKEHVRFEPQYLEEPALLEWLAAADICILPYVEPDQVSSGTLCWAMGSAKPVIATHFRYAQEILASDCGRLVPLRDSTAIRDQLMQLLDDRGSMARIGERAHSASRRMRWSDVAASYDKLFRAVVNRHRNEHSSRESDHTLPTNDSLADAGRTYRQEEWSWGAVPL